MPVRGLQGGRPDLEQGGNTKIVVRCDPVTGNTNPSSHAQFGAVAIRAIADGLDLLQAMLPDQVLAGFGQLVQGGDHRLGGVCLAIGGEADEVGEQHDDAMVAPRRHEIG